MSSNDKSKCDDLTPSDDCNKTCCPEYEPDSDWCKAFNVRTLEQLKEVTDVSLDGMWFNIEDAKNTIAQTEQYLTMIYELLLACHDQVMKASSSAARTVGDFESASAQVKEYVNEIHLIVGGSQYNGRHLLQDTTTAKRGFHATAFEADDGSGLAAYGTGTNFTITQTIVSATGDVIEVAITTGIDVGAHVYTDAGASYGKVIDIDANGTHFTVTLNSGAGSVAGQVLHITPAKLTDKIINDDSVERSAIRFRLKGPRGFCRNVGNVFNDFQFDLPPVGVHSLGLTSFTSKGGQDYHIEGLAAWTDDDGIIGPDGADDDNVDETVSDFNCAIKTIGVELDKMRAYRYTCCLREKQVRIYKAGQEICMKNKMKI